MKNNSGPRKGFYPLAILLAACSFILLPLSGRAATNVEPLRLSAMPPAAHDGGPPQGRQEPTGGQEGRPAGGPGHGSHGQGGQESEHQPKPMRTYWLNTCGITDEARAFVVRPEGAVEPVDIERQGHEVKVTIRTPFGDGPAHGANNVYLIDRHVEDATLIMATAKWLTIHHNCGWGHDHKFNPTRMQPQAFAQAPLEMVVEGLWDGNFHSSVMSGDLISFQVLSFDKPAAGASVLIESDQGWQKRLVADREGRGSFQMVRDYYPDSWQVFDRRRRGSFKMTASYETAEKGQYEGAAYDRVQMSSTFSWRYYPARQEYVSYTYGLLLASLAMTAAGFGVYSFRERRRKPHRSVTFDE